MTTPPTRTARKVVMTMRLQLNGEVMSNDWADLYRYFGFDTGFYCPGDIRAAIDGLEDGEELVLEVNSVGGDVDAAAEIYSVLQGCDHPTRAEVQSLAASAASYLILACDRVEIARPAQMMIHLASLDIGGNKHDHQWAAQALDATDNSILDTYLARTGDRASREELTSLMEGETYLTAEQCVAMGLADGILGDRETDEAGEPVAVVASVTGNLRRALRVLPDIRELKARKDREDWQRRARLELERARAL